MTAASLRDLIVRRAAIAPDAFAIGAPDRPSLSYRELLVQMEEIEASLRAFGLAERDRVAIVLGNGPELAVAFLGIAAACGCAPLNPAYKEQELEFYLTDLRARAIVLEKGTDSAARSVAQEMGLLVIDLAKDRSGAAGRFTLEGPKHDPAAERRIPKGDDVALLLHTSGTTSRPKLVPLSHANLCRSAANIQATLALGPNDRCLNVMPLFHIHGLVAAVLSSLAAGGETVCTSGFDPERFLGWLGERGATWYTAVPTIHQAVLAAFRRSPRAIEHRLRFIRSSSASLPPTVFEELERAFGVPVIEAYGMTEAAHQMASNPLPPRARKPGSVGIAQGPEIAIMDGSGRLLPPGETGEVVIRGPNVTKGYEADPSVNAAAFSDGWFRTGDLGALDGEGYLWLRGRSKEQINRAGEKIAPLEVDNVLLQHPSVAEAVTFAVPHATLGEDVAAAVVVHPGAKVTESDLRSFAAARLADHKVPSRVLLLDRIPKGPTGKIQRVLLAGALKDALEVDYRAPADPVEAELARIFAEVLRKDRVSAEDNFFALGGDSLQATLIVAEARRANLEVTMEQIVEHPVVRELAKVVARAQKIEPETAPVLAPFSLLTVEDRVRFSNDPAIEDAFPVIDGQLLYLLMNLLHPESGIYNQCLHAVLAGPLDPDRFQRAWSIVVARHPILRAAFTATGVKRPLARILKSAEPRWSVLDWQDRSSDEIRRELPLLIRRELSAPFDLEAGPLLRFVLVRSGPERHELLWSSFHAILDAWSERLLLGEVLTTYGALLSDGTPELPSAVPFSTHVAWLAKQRFDGGIAYCEKNGGGPREGRSIFSLLDWLGTLSEETIGALRRMGERPKPVEIVERRLAIRADALQAWAARHNLFLNTILQGAWSLVLARATGRDSVILETVVSGRRSGPVGSEAIIGDLSNSLPLRAAIPRDRSIVAWLADLQDELIAMSRHEHTPLSLRNGGASESHVWNFHQHPPVTARGGGLHVVQARDYVQMVELDPQRFTMLDLFPGDDLDVRLSFGPSGMDRTLADRILDDFDRTLAELVTA